MHEDDVLKCLYLDVETTGVSVPDCGIWQISGMIEVCGDVKEEFDFKVRPFEKDKIFKEALDIGGVSEEEIKAYPLPSEVYNEFISMLSKYVDKFDRKDKFHFIGYNAKFDAEHMRSWFLKNSDKYFGSWFFNPPVDVMALSAFNLLYERKNMVDFKLKTVSKKLGLDVDESRLHDAMYDIFLTREIFRIFIER